jgi:hypothetical protein
MSGLWIDSSGLARGWQAEGSLHGVVHRRMPVDGYMAKQLAARSSDGGSRPMNAVQTNVQVKARLSLVTFSFLLGAAQSKILDSALVILKGTH